MEENKEDAVGGGAGGGGGRGQTRNPIPDDKPTSVPNSASPQFRGSSGKSCKGCLYYSSLHKSKSKNPTCVGLSKTLQQVPSYIVGETELEASKEGRSLTDFKYACVGYSVYLDNKDSSVDSKDKTAKLPFCVGLEVLLDKGPSTTPVGHAPTSYPAQKSEEHEGAIPQPRRYNPPHTTSRGEEYLNRFKRNAGLVASGVGKNLNRVGNYVKDTLEDILYPYRRRPK